MAHTVDFDLDGATGKSKPIIVEDEEDVQPTNLAAEMLQIHHQCGHISFARIQEMAKLGMLPKRLAKCPVPTCSACLYAKAIRRKWRGKTANNSDEAKEPLKPGECVSVDQLKSPTPGLIAQLSGFLTTKRYGYTTVYIDHASQLGFVYLKKGTTADETLEGKIAFEQYAKDRGVTIQTYHADDGIFRAHKWVEACKNKGQSLTFAGVNTHHQNGMAERRIRTLQEHASVGKPLFILFYESIFRDYSAFMTDRLTRLVYDFISSTTKKVSKTKKYPEPIFHILILIPSHSKHSRFDPDFYKDPLTTSTDQVFSFQSYFLQRSPYYFNDTISEFASTISFHRSSPEYLVQISS
jgi:transposase InsO family protein